MKLFILIHAIELPLHGHHVRGKHGEIQRIPRTLEERRFTNTPPVDAWSDTFEYAGFFTSVKWHLLER